ncbi:putative sugar phosphate/phosphate translocator [Sesamum angolense]|uniref:Sugar phosphate/phosphate translocator n=1 Tax=Sesamum angolense TaxID=2727404 RepID=A0AAE2BU43_9LAMI|nr:putative sugar phosphate/phosphate translocator [Sesamum angolense]
MDTGLANGFQPISFTMIHMAFCSSLAFVTLCIFKLVELVVLCRRVHLSSIVPTDALYSLSLWLPNSAYIYLSVSFTQILKAFMHVIVYTIGILFKKDSYKTSTMCNMLCGRGYCFLW